MGLKKESAFILFILLIIAPCQAIMSLTNSALSPITLTTSSPENVKIYFLDVGQGDSILVKTPSKNILIDGGPTNAGSEVLNDLRLYDVAKIDLMVATHPHEDHIGGLVAVLQSSMQTQDVIYNGVNYTTQTFNIWKTLAAEHNLTQASRGQVYSMSPSINFTILSPTSPTQFSDTNAESIVMKLQVGNTSVLLTGDAQFDSEQNMLSSGYSLQSQVLKVGHHGSSTSTSQAFLSAVAPTFAVISAGIGNTYGHPAQQTLNILANNNVITYGTYNYGTISFSLNSPTPSPIQTPSPSLTSNPTPTGVPTATLSPSNEPSQIPTIKPTLNPTSLPTNNPTKDPILKPSVTPTVPEISESIALMFLLSITAVFSIIFRKKNPT